MKWKLGLIVLLAFGAYFLVGSVGIMMRLSSNLKAAQQIRSELIEIYPEIKCDATAGYDSGIHLKIFGLTEPTKRVEIKDWLMRWKTDHDVSVPIWLQFESDERFMGSNSFEFARPDTFEL